jgi:hypothetical protein
MGSISKALARSRGIYNTAYTRASAIKQQGGILDFSGTDPFGGMSQYSNQSANQRRYSTYRGWYYSAVHAIAVEAAGQPFRVGKVIIGDGKKNRPGTLKSWQRAKITESIRKKSADQEIDILFKHPLIDAIEKPNSFQRRWQLVYNFIANLHLTGWSFLVGDVVEGKLEFYSVPTTWVHPDHSKGPYAEFKIFNPKDPSGEANAQPLDRNHVAFAYLPNPADPLSALAPAQAQMMAIEIDEKIQSSQKVFFDNGVFPSVIISVGSNPHPDIPGGIRPRLSPHQRRQINGMIRKVMSGVANYGNPAIIDGLIDKVERLSATQNEMGWEKSENKIRARILSALGVHPFILGEEMAGSYAQAYVVQDRFCKRVNAFLDMIGTIVLELNLNLMGSADDDGLIAWWEECFARDPQMERLIWEKARDRQDVTQNEFRSFIGLPPDEDGNEIHIDRQALQPIELIAEKVNSGSISEEQGRSILVAYGMPDELADKIAKKSDEKPAVQPQLPPPPPPPNGQQAPPDMEEVIERSISLISKIGA